MRKTAYQTERGGPVDGSIAAVAAVQSPVRKKRTFRCGGMLVGGAAWIAGSGMQDNPGSIAVRHFRAASA